MDYVLIWPTKFQNKTNGITPRRWLRFCNPELSNIISKWLKTDEWITNLDLLTGLRQVCSYVSDNPLEILCWLTYVLVDALLNSLPTMRSCMLSGLQPSWQANAVWHSMYCRWLVWQLTPVASLTFKSNASTSIRDSYSTFWVQFTDTRN